MPLKKIDSNRTSIKVILWGKEIGTLTWKKDQQQGYFIFAPEYFNQPYELCPLTYPKTEPESRQAIYGESLKSPDPGRRIYNGIPPFLADSLPDEWGNAVFDKWFIDNKLPQNSKTPIAKLSFIGNRAMGALEFKPMSAEGYYKDHVVDINELYKESLTIEKQLNNKFLKKAEKSSTEAIAALGTSPGGSRKKALISIAEDGTIHPGQIQARKGWKQYIIKFNDTRYGTSEGEKTYYDLAIMAGIKMMPSTMLQTKDAAHFITERYDRKEERKIFTQTLAAINPDAQTYEDLFLTCRKLGISEKEQDNLFLQTVFNFLMNNTDDHRKNFSFLMDEKFQWHLTPAYDLTFIFKDESLIPETQHCMSLRGKFDGVTENDLILFAKENNIKSPEKHIRKIREISDCFEQKALENGVKGVIIEIIGDRLNELGRVKNTQKEKPTDKIIFGHKVSNLEFEISQKGNIRINIDIDSTRRKLIITPKKTLYPKLIENGFHNIPEPLFEEIIKTITEKTNRNNLKF